MTRRLPVIAFALLGALAAPAALTAAPDRANDADARVVPRPSVLDLDSKGAGATTTPSVRSGNPLWAVPLNSLSVTRERPIFSASRRPPAAPVTARPAVQVQGPTVVRASVPDRPQLALIGTVAGAEGIAIFIDSTSHAIVRLRTGEGHEGWILRSVGGREVTLENERHTAILALPKLEEK